jgi:hypothetical protein
MSEVIWYVLLGLLHHAIDQVVAYYLHGSFVYLMIFVGQAFSHFLHFRQSGCR